MKTKMMRCQSEYNLKIDENLGLAGYTSKMEGFLKKSTEKTMTSQAWPARAPKWWAFNKNLIKNQGKSRPGQLELKNCALFIKNLIKINENQGLASQSSEMVGF